MAGRKWSTYSEITELDDNSFVPILKSDEPKNNLLISKENLIAELISSESNLSGISAAGTNQATATVLTKIYNRIDTVAAGTGVVEETTATIGMTRTVQNNGANDLLWYPKGTNQFYEIGVGLLGAGTPITITSGNQAKYICYDTGELSLI